MVTQDIKKQIMRDLDPTKRFSDEEYKMLCLKYPDFASYLLLNKNRTLNKNALAVIQTFLVDPQDEVLNPKGAKNFQNAQEQLGGASLFEDQQEYEFIPSQVQVKPPRIIKKGGEAPQIVAASVAAPVEPPKPTLSQEDIDKIVEEKLQARMNTLKQAAAVSSNEKMVEALWARHRGYK